MLGCRNPVPATGASTVSPAGKSWRHLPPPRLSPRGIAGGPNFGGRAGLQAEVPRNSGAGFGERPRRPQHACGSHRRGTFQVRSETHRIGRSGQTAGKGQAMFRNGPVGPFAVGFGPVETAGQAGAGNVSQNGGNHLRQPGVFTGTMHGAFPGRLDCGPQSRLGWAPRRAVRGFSRGGFFRGRLWRLEP